MKGKSNIAVILTLAMTFCFILVLLAQAEEKVKSLKWADHKPNPRFAIYDPGSPTKEVDDLVLDRKTGLIWARNANLAGKQFEWEDATNHCQNLALGDCKGWRLPTKEELSSLIDPTQTAPPLPKGHSFINVGYTYWTSTPHEDLSEDAYFVHFGKGEVVHAVSKMHQFSMWPVLGP